MSGARHCAEPEVVKAGFAPHPLVRIRSSREDPLRYQEPQIDTSAAAVRCGSLPLFGAGVVVSAGHQ